MKKTIIIFLVLTIGIIPSFSALAKEPVYNEITRDYRPEYKFSYDIFKNLPSFPKEFWIRKQLFDSQQIQAERLTEEYFLQPEIIPGWDNWKDKIYGISEKNHTGVYGISIYPSKFDIFNAEIGDTFNISALLYTTFGVEIYQGAKIVTKYDETKLNVTYQGENKNILLAPTYPEFDNNWCRKIVFQITVLDYGNHTIKIWEEKPDIDKDNEWENYYGNKYTSGGSILGMRMPKMKINVFSPSPETPPNEKMPENGFYARNIGGFVIIFVFLIFLVIGVYYAIRNNRNKRKKRE